MDLPVERWLAAVACRASRRNFDASPLEEDALARLETTCREFRPFPEARAELVRGPAAGVFRGILGAYGRITGAPCYMAFIGDLASARVQECAGYTGEGLILEATSLGLGTCWVGGFFGRETVSSQVELGGSERVLAISPVGRARTKPSLTDISFKFVAGSRKRKPLAELVEGSVVPDDGVRKGLDAARLAPSAVNRQPWRFKIEDGAVLVRADKDEKDPRISRRLDCGIAMLHFELGVRASGLAGRWEFLPPPGLARFKFRSK
jgi:hypothetical protein